MSLQAVWKAIRQAGAKKQANMASMKQQHTSPLSALSYAFWKEAPLLISALTSKGFFCCGVAWSQSSRSLSATSLRAVPGLSAE
eukprot:1161480-Pelagomonas_calceolata.AAC.28